MRLIGLLLVMTGVACATPQTPTASTTQSGGIKIDARYILSTPSGTVGTIMSIVRCGPVIYLADAASRIHRLNVQDGHQEAPIEDRSLLPMALAADCDRGRVWAISPKPRGQSLRVVAFDVTSASPVKEFAIEVPCFPTSGAVSGDFLFVGGECIEGAKPDRNTAPAAATYYANKRIGVRVSLNSGEVESGLVPFETACEGAGACVGGSIAALGEGWLVTLPLSPRVGVYSRYGELLRAFPVGSVGATARDGSRLAASASSEERVNWSSRNSLIHGAFVVGDRIVVAHYLLDVPKNWTMSAPTRPQYKARINLLTLDGQPQDVDIAVPEMPVGSDNEALYAVDYGPNGRQGAHETVTVLRVVLPKS